MDPIAVLQNRIEQLEAKLGLAQSIVAEGQQGDSTTANLLHASQAISSATAGHEKLPDALQMANELNNYMDPNLLENIQQGQMHKQEVIAAEPALRHHCHCMHHFQKAAPVMESEAIQQVPQMQDTVEQMKAATVEIKAESDAVSHGVQELAETCGAAASDASEQLANIAQKVEQVEEKKFPKRRNGLD